MTAKTISLPALPPGLTLTCQVRNITTLALLETVALTAGSGDDTNIYSGSITGSHAGQLLFVVLVSGTVLQYRIRTIADVAATFVILTEMETLAIPVTGAYLVNITITDGTNPVQNARVRMIAGGTNESRLTNVSGVAAFGLDAATYSVTVTAAGFTSYTTTLAVSANTDQTYALTLIAVTPPGDPSVSTGTMLVLDENNNPETTISISLQLVAGPGIAGYGLDTKVRTQVSNGSGIVTFTRLRRGATYSVWRGPANDVYSGSAFVAQPQATRQTFVVPDADSFNIAEVLGLDV